MARLGDVFSVIRNGASIKQTDGAGGLPITRIETISNREVDRNKLGYAGIKGADKYRGYILQDGDILMSHINSEKHLGKVALYKKQGNEIIIHGMNLLMLRANEALAYPPFAAYYFETNMFLNQIQRITKKSVNQASFTVTALKEIEMPLPPLEEQRRIAATLDKVSGLIAKRREQLDKLDELVKARFVEMFGDLKSNPHGWDTFLFGEYFDITSSKRILKSEWKSKGIPFLRVRDMVQLASTGKIDNEFFVSEKFYASLSDSDGVPKQGDILVSATSTLGKCHVVNAGERFYFKDADVLRFRAIKAINPVFFMEQMKTDYIKGQIDRTLGITTVPHFTIKAAKTINMRCPDINLQNEFATFVTQTNKSKLTIQQSLDKLEVLKKALMQQYFG